VTEREGKKGPLAAGTLVGNRFRIERWIEGGGMGDVYAARHVTTGKVVALKIVRSTDRVWRFTREARAATAVKHPNVVEVYDLFEDADGTPVMVMELLQGETFAAYRARVGALTLYDAAQILVPVLRGVHGAHAKGIVHRDIKPANIFLAESPAGRVPKILDFGIAKMLDPAKLGSDTHGQATTNTAILGTPDYMSFEQAMSDEIDVRTDIWSVGVIVFEALTGRRPIVFDTLGQMYAAFLQGTVPAVRSFAPDLPPDVANIIDRCLAKKKEDRLDDLAPLIDVLDKYADGSVAGAMAGGRVVDSPAAASRSTEAPMARTIARPSLRRPRFVIAAVALATAAAGTGLWARSHFVPTLAPDDQEDGVAPPDARPSLPWGVAEVSATRAGAEVTTADASVTSPPLGLADAPHADEGSSLHLVVGRVTVDVSKGGSVAVPADAQAAADARHGIAVTDPYDAPPYDARPSDVRPHDAP
jgi:hypothetical protein